MKNNNHKNINMRTDRESVYTVDETKTYDDYGGERKDIQDVKQSKCPACGATMTYDPETKSLRCSYCNAGKSIRAKQVEERSLRLGYDTAVKWRRETRVFRCSSCGAETVFEKTQFATSCPFCGSNSVTSIEDLEGVRPNGVIPFVVTRAAAEQNYYRWIKGRAFAPRAFKKCGMTASGIYLPTWTFDSRTYSAYEGVVGDESMADDDGNRTVTYRRVRGDYSRFFDDYLVYSGGQIEPNSFYAMRFDTNHAAEYNEAFLAGFSAEHYALPLADGWGIAQGGMRRAVYDEIVRSLHCDTVKYLNINTGFHNNTFKYVLAPVYVVHVPYKGKNYRFAASGVNGQVSGKYPKSFSKILGTVFGILAGIAAVAATCCYFIFR